MAWSRKVERELNTRKRERILRKEPRKLLQEREGEEETDGENTSQPEGQKSSEAFL